MSGFLKGELCGEPARGGPCRRTLGHGGGHRHDGKERVVERDDHKEADDESLDPR